MTRATLRFAFALLAFGVGFAPASAIPARFDEPGSDPTYRFEIVSEESIGGCAAYIVKMTSQKWRGREWWHWLSILVPEKVDHSDAAVLFITGGSQRSSQPDGSSREAAVMSQLATRSRTVVAVLQQVPNQPLYDDLYEDDLISFTFEKYLDSGDKSWPLLQPMVKSAVRAMDTVASVMEKKSGERTERFVVTGASKRGWTTWLTAAEDRRVVAIAPMVIDMLNMQPQLEQQMRSYGGFSEEIKPYSSKNIPERMSTERGKQLRAMVDPFEHRQALTMPKLVVLGTNDPYWTVDASSLYFPQLSGAKNLFYLANAGHGLGLGIMPTLVTFFRTSLDGATLPQLDWRTAKDMLHVDWKVEGGKARLWRAESDSRDFRQARWRSTPLDGSTSCEVQLEHPESGWAACYVEVRFAGDGEKFGVATEIVVRPERFPFKAPADASARRR